MPSRLDVAATAFGSGDANPYNHALRDGARSLFLHDHDARIAAGGTRSTRVDLNRFLADADDVDARALRGVRGPVLDIGCGPGRLVRAAIKAGHLALGVDVSPVAVDIAQQEGLPVLHRSVFQDLPAEGEWGAALLIDGNIGIGGDPAALLQRCASLIRPVDGCLVIETHPDPSRDRAFSGIIIDDLDRESTPFPWAEVGSVALRGYAARSELRLRREWTAGSRTFARYSRA